jgi:CheY-specific phosphatase CheX
MQPTDYEQVFLESASEVMETMFFTGVVPDEGNQDDSAALLSAELTFHGKVSGKFGVRLPLHSARLIGANFLGSDEVSDEQAAQVVCELANMLCGSVLSRVEGEARFELRHPELDKANRDWRSENSAVGYTFGTEEGSLTMWIAFEPRMACPAA